MNRCNRCTAHQLKSQTSAPWARGHSFVSTLNPEEDSCKLIAVCYQEVLTRFCHLPLTPNRTHVSAVQSNKGVLKIGGVGVTSSTSRVLTSARSKQTALERWLYVTKATRRVTFFLTNESLLGFAWRKLESPEEVCEVPPRCSGKPAECAA